MHWNTSLNGTGPETVQLQRISIPVASMMCVQGLIIVSLNFIVVITLLMKKNKFPSVYWLQLLCLALNDALAGLANSLISFIDHSYISNSLVSCASIVGFLFISQSASLYNIFGICVHRFFVLKRYNQIGFIWKRYYTICCTITAWTLSTCLCSVPLVLYHKSEDYARIRYCSLQQIFGEDKRKGLLIMMLGSFICPLVLINIAYAVLFCKFKLSDARVRPNAVANIAGSISNPQTPEVFSTGITRQAAHGSTNVYSIRSCNESELNSKGIVKAQKNIKIGHLRVPENRRYIVKKPTLKSLLTRKQLKFEKEEHQSASPQPSMAAIRQRKAFTFLGIVLLFLNIFSWFAIASLVIASSFDSIQFGRNILLPWFTTMCLNSAVNPLLYAARIPEFRASLVEILHNLYKLMTCKS